MAKHKVNELVRCEYCGEDYSATYRRCPFCNDTGILDEEENDTGYGYDDDLDDDREDGYGRGGRRQAQGDPLLGRRQAFRVVGAVVAVGLLVAIVLLALAIVRPLLGITSGKNTADNASTSAVSSITETQTEDDLKSNTDDVTDTNTSTDTNSESTETATSEQSASADDNTQTANDTQSSGTTDDTQTADDDSQTSGQSGTTTSSVTATKLTLNSEDFTLFSVGETNKLVATLSPVGSKGTVTWESDDTSVASVDTNGKVTAVGKGTATITAMLPNGATESCIVRCNITSTTSTSASKTSSSTTSSNTTSTTTKTSSGTSSASSSYTLNNADFTLLTSGETYQLKVQDYSGSVTWVSSDSAVATVNANGKVTAVANGTCKVTAKLANGKSLTCIVRVHFSE